MMRRYSNIKIKATICLTCGVERKGQHICKNVVKNKNKERKA